MTSITPMFPGWHRKLYGRRPIRSGIEMRRKAVEISSLCLRQAKDLFGDLLATELLEKVPGVRNRSFPLPVVFWIFLCQVLSGGSCRYGVASVQALLSRHGKVICSPNTAAYRKERVRIPIRLLIKIHRHLVAASATSAASSGSMSGLVIPSSPTVASVAGSPCISSAAKV